MKKYTILYDIIKQSNIKTVDDFIKNIDQILDVAKEDTLRYFMSENKKTSDFDFYYGQAAQEIKKTLKNLNLRKIKELFEQKNLENFCVFLVVRLKNKIVSLGTDQNLKLYAKAPLLVDFEDGFNFNNENQIQNIEIEDFLQKIEKDKLKNGLKKAWNDGFYNGFGDFEFSQLCLKFGFTPVEILGYDPSEIPEIEAQTSTNGRKHLAFVF